jgi:hypothetical protein
MILLYPDTDEERGA